MFAQNNQTFSFNLTLTVSRKPDLRNQDTHFWFIWYQRLWKKEGWSLDHEGHSQHQVMHQVHIPMFSFFCWDQHKYNDHYVNSIFLRIVRTKINIYVLFHIFIDILLVVIYRNYGTTRKKTITSKNSWKAKIQD